MQHAWNKTANLHPENGQEVIFRDFFGKEYRGIFRNYGPGIVYVGNTHVCTLPEWRVI